MDCRGKEQPRLWFRSERYFRCNERWYFHTREGFVVGPYDSRLAAEIDAGILIEMLRNTPAHQALAITRDFVMHTGTDLDYLNHPAFSGYLVAEDDVLTGQHSA